MVDRMTCLALALSLGAAALAGEAPKEKGKEPAPEAPKPTTHTVKAETFKVEAQLKGAFESPHAAEIVFRPEAWAELTVLDAAMPGTPVKKGDTILRLDTQKIDEALKDAEAGLAAMDPALKTSQEELAAMEKTLDMDLSAAQRAKQYADEDFKRYTDTDRPSAVKQAHFSVKNAANYLEYETEELRQLEKMYKAGDVTEETEEIILKRQRDTVERVAFGLEVAKQKAEQTLKVDLPRQDITTKENTERQVLALAKAKVAIPAALVRKRLEVEKLKTDQARAAEKLQKMRKDREAMVVKSPTDGVVYCGPCVRGAWPRLGQAIERGALLKPHDVVMTVVQAKDLFVRAAVPEDQLERVASGGQAEVVPVGYPSTKLAAKLDGVTPVPVTPGNFEAKLTLSVPKDTPPLVPGMSANVKVTSYEKKDALVVPTAALVAEGEATFVYVQKSPGEHDKRPVVVGKRADGKAEILKGLSVGEVVMLEKPEK